MVGGDLPMLPVAQPQNLQVAQRAPAATPQPPRELAVQVPRGTNAGDLFNFSTPDGGTVVLKCPQPYPPQGKFKFMWTPGMGGGSDKGAAAYSTQPIQVTVPRGVNAGGKFNFQLPDGRMVEVNVPSPFPPQGKFMFQPPPAPASAPAPAAHVHPPSTGPMPTNTGPVQNVSVRLEKTPAGFGLGLSNDNVVTLLAPGGQAAMCGQLMINDKVTGVNGTFLSASTTLSSIVGPLPIGSRIVLNIQRPQGGGAPPPMQPQPFGGGAPPAMMAPPAPAPAMAPQPQKMRVQIPPGVMGGQVIQVQTPTGQMMQVQVPPGMMPGQQFEMALPDLGQQVPPAQPQAVAQPMAQPQMMAGPGMAAPTYPGMGGGAPPPMVQGYGGGGAPTPYGGGAPTPYGGGAPSPYGGAPPAYPAGGSAYPQAAAPGYPPAGGPPGYPAAAPAYPAASMYPPTFQQPATAYPQAAPPAYPGGGGYPPSA